MARACRRSQTQHRVILVGSASWQLADRLLPGHLGGDAQGMLQFLVARGVLRQGLLAVWVNVFAVQTPSMLS